MQIAREEALVSWNTKDIKRWDAESVIYLVEPELCVHVQAISIIPEDDRVDIQSQCELIAKSEDPCGETFFLGEFFFGGVDLYTELQRAVIESIDISSLSIKGVIKTLGFKKCKINSSQFQALWFPVYTFGADPINLRYSIHQLYSLGSSDNALGFATFGRYWPKVYQHLQALYDLQKRIIPLKDISDD